MRRLLPSFTFFVAIIFLLIIPSTGFAAVDMFIKFEGPDIQGESQDQAHRDEIDVLSWSFGADMALSYDAGGAPRTTKAVFNEFTFSKYVDKASPSLFLTLARGEHFAKVTFTVRKAGVEPIDYLIITMEQVIVTSLSSGSGLGEDRIPENVSLNFGKINYEYVTIVPDGTPGGSIIFSWDIEANSEI